MRAGHGAKNPKFAKATKKSFRCLGMGQTVRVPIEPILLTSFDPFIYIYIYIYVTYPYVSIIIQMHTAVSLYTIIYNLIKIFEKKIYIYIYL